jgi:hypothetical protein
MITCVLIPVISLGGALPALIGFGGVGGTLTVSRLKSWSVALRVGVCAAIVLACWSTFGLLVTAVSSVKAVNIGKQPIASTRPAPSSTE